ELTLPDPMSPSPGMQGDQVLIGSVELDQTLYPGQCVTKNVSATAQPPMETQGDGAYYLAAIVDTNRVEQELREDNNVHVGGLMGVGSRSDLVVTEVNAPVSVWNGQSFTASVKVCNQGTQPTSGGYYSRPSLELFLSTDDELTLSSPSMPTDQMSIGYVELDQQLYPGQCVTQNVSATAYLPQQAQEDGAYYLAAIVDANRVEMELREDNNVHVSGLMGVGNRSDLVVTEVSGPASVGHGQSFTASVKVCNQGTQPTSGGSYSKPSLELFLSTDDELTLPSPGTPYPPPGSSPEQNTIGSVELDQTLYPGQCVTKSVSASAHLPPAAQGDGAYYLAAAVDTTGLEQELREDNNLRVGGLMGVGSRPDLVVTEVNGPASVEHGQGFTASVKVCNQGTASTNGYTSKPRMELLLSLDTELTLPSPGMPSPDMPDQRSIGSVELDQPLSPGQCVTQNVSATAHLPQQAQGNGAYYLAAIVDTNRVEMELREDNNVHVGGLVGVGYQSDLVVTEVSAPASVQDGQAFTATVKVCNQGTSPSSGYMPRVELFLSTDDELTLPSQDMPYPPPGPSPEQLSLGFVELAEPLSPAQCVTKDVSASAYLPPAAQGDGAYYLVAAVDTTLSEYELREDNNVRVSGLMGVGYRADLVVTEVHGPASVTSGESFTTTVKVCNQGTAPAPDTAWLAVFLSMDTHLTLPTPGLPPPTDQVKLGSLGVEPLAAGQCVTRDMSVSPALPPEAQGPGVFHLGAIIDTELGVQELREDNNARADSSLEVTP
ncbi:CARDB domain-containing protein, partial [Archangium sp.]|uniref:CARDB domain-containing protein n=1 Tax=Archangium sp. TaxID=1872627 RepID=UPI002D527288